MYCTHIHTYIYLNVTSPPLHYLRMLKTCLVGIQDSVLDPVVSKKNGWTDGEKKKRK